MKNLRDNIKDKEFKDQKICDNFFKEFDKYKKVLIYMSVKNEVDTIPIINRLLEKKKEVYLPRCTDREREMNFYKISSLSDLKIGKYSILEPKSDIKLADTKDCICIVPALAFDLSGFRIGYGKGYYDEFLKNNNVISVGICYNEQICELIPKEEHDKNMDYIITDKFTKEIHCG